MTNLITKIHEVPSRERPKFVTTHSGKRKQVVGVNGYVHYVLGKSDPVLTVGDTTIYQGYLNISLGDYEKNWGIRFRYNRDSGLYEGNHITAGSVVDDEETGLIKEAAYIAYWEPTELQGRSRFQKVEYAREMNPTDEELRIIVSDD